MRTELSSPTPAEREQPIPGVITSGQQAIPGLEASAAATPVPGAAPPLDLGRTSHDLDPISEGDQICALLGKLYGAGAGPEAGVLVYYALPEDAVGRRRPRCAPGSSRPTAAYNSTRAPALPTAARSTRRRRTCANPKPKPKPKPKPNPKPNLNPYPNPNPSLTLTRRRRTL